MRESSTNEYALINCYFLRMTSFSSHHENPLQMIRNVNNILSDSQQFLVAIQSIKDDNIEYLLLMELYTSSFSDRNRFDFCFGEKVREICTPICMELK